MQVAEDKVVSVSYYLTANKEGQQEELVEQTAPDRPFVFLNGFGGVLPEFEGNLNGKQKGDKFDFRIKAESAYGVFEKDYVVKIDKQSFIVDGKFDDTRVKLGEDIEMNDQDGNQLVGRVLEITDAHVEMDFNHPLAGMDLHFVGEVLDVRDASQEELDHGHVHGPHGHHH
ncbi:MAG: FKBP-type peptidyl-prolyl cis-trans isomerase [Sphingobacteriaceae bacterium]|nr:FKBP-type peptidyl-prolyl cis-trans isomerase [Sphingobacteriaceae bacterium]